MDIINDNILEQFKNSTEDNFIYKNKEKIEKLACQIRTCSLLDTLNNLIKLYGCVQIDTSGNGYLFLNDLNLHYQNDRQLVNLISQIRNYFYPQTSNKKNEPSFVQSNFYFIKQLDILNEQYKVQLSNLIQVNKRPYLSESLIEQNQSISNFTNQALQQIEDQVQDLLKNLNKCIGLDFEQQNIENQLKRNINELILSILTMSKDFYERNPKAKTNESLQKLKEFSFQQVINTYQDYQNFIRTIKTFFQSKTSEQINPKVPKGTKDTEPQQMLIKSKVIDTIKGIYKQHGACEIDTPIFELKETLLGKYGEEGGKLIYDLEDQGGELLSLRYDLTVPFARFMGTHNLQELKRFHIGKVYRRDQPNMNKGRFREFYQCDIDIAGTTQDQLAEAELLYIVCKVFRKFNLQFKFKVSHRVLLEAIIECAECEPQKFKTICSSIDKLDKESWSEVVRELKIEKGLNQDQIDKLEKLVLHQGTIFELIEKLKNDQIFGDNEKAAKSFDELKRLGEHLKIFGCYDEIILDLSLARGLDYYTGVIYEAVLTEESQLGSIASGGRYDGLIGMFSKKAIPSVGISIGIERLFVMLEDRLKQDQFIKNERTQVFVGTIGKGLNEQRLKIIKALWDNGFKAEYLYESDPRPDKQLKKALQKEVPVMVWVAEEEFKNNQIKVKFLEQKTEETIAISELTQKLNDYFKK